MWRVILNPFSWGPLISLGLYSLVKRAVYREEVEIDGIAALLVGAIAQYVAMIIVATLLVDRFLFR